MIKNITLELYKNLFINILVCIILLSGIGCNGEGGSGVSNGKFSVGGSIAGLNSGQTVVLVNNKNTKDTLSLSQDGKFIFKELVPEDSNYNVTVLTQPKDAVCTVIHGQGVAIIADVTNIRITCSEDKFTIGGVLQGLEIGQRRLL